MNKRGASILVVPSPAGTHIFLGAETTPSIEGKPQETSGPPIGMRLCSISTWYLFENNKNKIGKALF